MTTHHTPLAAVSIEPADGGWTLIFVRELRHPPQKVWAALTEPGQVARWAPFETDRDLSTKGDAVLTMIDGNHKVESSATVTRAQAPALLEYRWGDDRLRWELTPTAGGTRLTLSHTHEQRDWLPKLAAGWHICLDVAEQPLDGEPVEAIRGSAAREHGWDELDREYAEATGLPYSPMPPSE